MFELKIKYISSVIICSDFNKWLKKNLISTG